MEETLPETQA